MKITIVIMESLFNYLYISELDVGVCEECAWFVWNSNHSGPHYDVYILHRDNQVCITGIETLLCLSSTKIIRYVSLEWKHSIVLSSTHTPVLILHIDNHIYSTGVKTLQHLSSTEIIKYIALEWKHFHTYSPNIAFVFSNLRWGTQSWLNSSGGIFRRIKIL